MTRPKPMPQIDSHILGESFLSRMFEGISKNTSKCLFSRCSHKIEFEHLLNISPAANGSLVWTMSHQSGKGGGEGKLELLTRHEEYCENGVVLHTSQLQIRHQAK